MIGSGAPRTSKLPRTLQVIASAKTPPFVAYSYANPEAPSGKTDLASSQPPLSSPQGAPTDRERYMMHSLQPGPFDIGKLPFQNFQ